jgi:hypothetical protein
MSHKILPMLPLTAALAIIILSSNAAFAQFPPPPPMAGPPPTAAGGPPPLAAGGPPAFAARPPMGPGGAPRAGLGSPAVANATRATSMAASRVGDYGRYGEPRHGYRAAYAAGAYAAYAYGGSRYSPDSDCYYVYRHYRRVTVCE